MIKRTVCAILLLLIIMPFISLSTSAKDIVDEINIEIPPEAGAVYLYSYNGNRVLFSNDDSAVRSPASTAKMMSGLLVCRQYKEKLNTVVTITSEMLTGIEGITIGLTEGMQITIKDLLYGTICAGGNDAAQALAIACGGSISEFVSEMNRYARRLDMRSTKYSNPTGLDHLDAVTTLSDTAKLAASAATDELYVCISSANSYTIDTGSNVLTIYNRNALISQFSAQGYLNKTANGLISGSTDDGGYVLAVYAKKNNTSLLCVIMGAQATENEIYSYATANKLLEYAFDNYTEIKILGKNEQITNASVNLALEGTDRARIPCIPEADVYAFLPVNADLDKISCVTYLHDEALTAPIQKGTVVGGVDIYYNGKYVTSSKLISADNIDVNFILKTVDHMKNTLTSRMFWMSAITAGILIAFYIISSRKNSRHQRVSKVQFKKFY